MKTMTLITLILSLILIVIGGAEIFHWVGTFGILISLLLFSDIFYFQKRI